MSEPVPQRIGDAERDRAADYLREHMSVGRLTQEEFDERLTAALQARTAADLEPLFSDLPAPKPGQEIAPTGSTVWPVYQAPASSPATRPLPAASPMPNSTVANALTIASGIAWPAWLLFCFAFGWNFWWLVFIPVIISGIAGQQKEELKRREQLWQKQQNPQLPPGSTEPPA